MKYTRTVMHTWHAARDFIIEVQVQSELTGQWYAIRTFLTLLDYARAGYSLNILTPCEIDHQ